MISRRESLIGLGLAFSGLGVLAAKPNQSTRSLFNMEEFVPDRIGDWVKGASTVDAVPQLTAYERSVYEQVVVRHYFKRGALPITLLMAHNRAQSFSSELHRPDVCYPASGFKVLSRQALILPLPIGQIPANYLRAIRGARQDGVLYFTRIGDSFPATLLQQRLDIVQSVFNRQEPDGIVFRLSTPATADQTRLVELKDFASAFYLALPIKGRQILAGAHLSEKDE